MHFPKMTMTLMSTDATALSHIRSKSESIGGGLKNNLKRMALM